MLIGYARVSTDDQSLDLQLAALREAGCEKIFEDRGMSGIRADRPGLHAALEFARTGDVLVVWRLDRLSRSLRHLVETVNDLSRRNIELRSLKERIDTTSAAGKLVFHIFAALAEFERDLIRERVISGLAAARAKGKVGGRPRVLDAKRVELARKMLAGGESSLAEVARLFRVSERTLRRYLKDSST